MSSYGNMPYGMHTKLQAIATIASIAAMDRIVACKVMAGDEKVVTILNIGTGRVYGLYEDQLERNLPADLARAIKEEWGDETFAIVAVFWFDDDGKPLSAEQENCNTAYLCMMGDIPTDAEEEKPAKQKPTEGKPETPGRRYMVPPASINLN